jgi:hypothetical protein
MNDKMCKPYCWQHNNQLQGQREILNKKGYIGVFVILQIIQ